MRPGLAILSAFGVAVAWALGPCTYISPDEDHDLCHLDEDGDGVPRCDERTLVRLDCNDVPEWGGENETPGADEIPYDGYDNDCDGSDQLDIDDDNYPGISREDYEAVFEADPWLDPMDIEFEWTANLKDEVDCDDEDDEVYPGADEVVGDGIDQDCDGWFELELP